MNKFTKKLMLIAGTLTILLLLQVFTFAEVRKMVHDKMQMEELLTERINKCERTLVEVQRLSSEERIFKIASDSLKLIKADRPYPVIEISKYEVEQITKIIDSKYE